MVKEVELLARLVRGTKNQKRRNYFQLLQERHICVSERVVTIQPQYLTKTAVPGVVFRPLRDDKMQWDMFLVWQRGKVSQIVKLLIDLLADKGAQISHDMP